MSNSEQNNYHIDYQLIAQIKSGDQRAFEQLMKKYYTKVFYTIKKLVKNEQDAEDLTLEVFAKIYYNIDMFTPYSSFKTWLLRIASNYAIDFLRKKKFNEVSLIINQEESEGQTNWIKTIGSDELNPEESFIQKQELQKLQKIIEQLPQKDKEIIKFRFFENMSYKEIAQILNIPIGTVKARLHRAKKLLSLLVKKFSKQ